LNAGERSATPESSPPPPPAPTTPPSFRAIAFNTTGHLASDISHSNGQFASWNHNAEFSLFAANAKHLFYCGVEYSQINYRFHDTPAWFDDCERTSLSLFYEHTLDKQWTLLAIAGGAIAIEESARRQDGAIGHIGFGAKFKYSKDFSLHGGAMVANRLSDGPAWLPYIGLNWQINPHWNLRTTSGATLTYDVFADNTLRFELTGAWRGVNFRLNNAPRGTPNRTRALESREGILSLGVTKEFFDRAAYIRATLGGSFFTKYKIRSYGSNIGEFKCDPALLFGIEAGFRF
jgi:hypothetical protein